MTDNTMRESVLKILTSYKQEMERYGYYTSNPGVSVDDFEEIADEIVAWQAAQSVPVVGEPVAWVRRQPDGALTAEFLEDAVIEPVRRNSGGWLPLIVKPTNYIPATELDALRKAAERLPALEHTLRHLGRELAKLDKYRLCMSYNDSYFGEPVGTIKRVVVELRHCIDAAMQERQP